MLSAFKNFLVTFLVGALLFGLIGYFVASYLTGVISDILSGEHNRLDEIINNSSVSTDEGNGGENNDPNLVVPDGDSFTFLIIGTDYRPDVYSDYYNEAGDRTELVDGYSEPLGVLATDVRYINATWMTLVRADKEKREFVSCYISPETRVAAPEGYTTLGDVYGRYGASVLCDYVGAMTGLDIDYSFLIDGINGEDFLSQMGSVKFELSADIYSEGRYHVSASTSIIEVTPDTEETETTDTTAESEQAAVEPKDDPVKPEENEEKEEGGDEPEEAPETEIVDNTLVLGAGNQSLSDYSVFILNTFKERSLDDITIKSTYILDMVEQYLRKCAGWSESDLTQKIMDITRGRSYGDDKPSTTQPLTGEFNDPYGSKPVLATNLSHENVSEIYSMLYAIEYFEYTEMVYPGMYSEVADCYIPDISAAVDFFKDYRSN